MRGKKSKREKEQKKMADFQELITNINEEIP